MNGEYFYLFILWLIKQKAMFELPELTHSNSAVQS